MTSARTEIIDVHMHVGLRGDEWPKLGHMTAEYREKLIFKIFCLYGRIKLSEADEVTDRILKDKTLEAIDHCGIDKVVCLALDHVYTPNGDGNAGRSMMWVSNEYIVNHLRKELPKKILLGASVHPYDKDFSARLKDCVDREAVLMKWLPSAQQIDLAEEKTRAAMIALAAAKPGKKPLPLLLHVGPEYAIISTDERTNSFNCLCWTAADRIANALRFKKRWHTPRVKKIHENIRAALDAGAVIIFAHCGLPYYASGPLGRLFEHSDFEVVSAYLREADDKAGRSRTYADVSAICTPFRKPYFDDIARLPEDRLLFGSDFPTPVFELSADLKENWEDFKAVLKGDLTRIVIPEDNLIDVNHRELKVAFGADHPMFTNFNRLR